MSEFQKQNQDNNIWHSPIMLFLMLVVVLVFMYNMIDIIEKVRETSKKEKLVSEQFNQLKEKEIFLNNDIERLKTKEGIDEEIIQKYQLVKPGEKMVVIVDDEKVKESEQIEPKKSFWQKI